MRQHLKRLPLVTLCLATAACALEQQPSEESVSESLQALSIEDIPSIDVPFLSLAPAPGLQVHFFYWEDGSAAYHIEATEGAADVSNVEFAVATVAEAFWAFSEPGEKVPEVLLHHHALLAAEGSASPWTDVTIENNQGWFWSMPMARGLSYCNNFTFASNHCFLAGGYSGAICKYDDSSHWVNEIWGTYRYKAGFCIDAGGELWDYLNYQGCTYGSGATIWLGTYASPWYGSFEWIAPFGATPRLWRHEGSAFSGYPPVYHARDWASKWGPAGYTCP